MLFPNPSHRTYTRADFDYDVKCIEDLEVHIRWLHEEMQTGSDLKRRIFSMQATKCIARYEESKRRVENFMAVANAIWN